MVDRPFTAVIVDDEPLAIEGLRRHCEAAEIVSIVGEARDGPSGLDVICRLGPDAIFLDISMPGMSGLDAAKAIAELSPAPLVVFVTAHDHYATEAFDLAVVDYVLKPIVAKRMHRAISRVAALLARRDARTPSPADFWVPFRGRIVRLAAGDIVRIEAERDYVRLFSTDNSYLIRATLTDMLARLDPIGFMRIHRSIAVARHRIAGFRHVGGGAWTVVDPDGAEAPIGRSYLAAVRRAEGF